MMIFKPHFVRIKKTLKTKFAIDVLWTFSSRLVVAVSGIILNVLIGNYYSAEGLGVFNQVFSIYMIVTIFSVFGINNSVLKHTAEFEDDGGKLGELLSSSLIIVFFFSIISVLIIFTSILTFGYTIENKPLLEALEIIILALPFFSLNKIFISFLNGRRQMKLLSVIQFARWLLIIVFLLSSIIAGKDLYFFVYSFLLTEFILLLFLSVINRNYIDFSLKYIKKWWKIHFIFGWKTFFAQSINEVNQRVDILMVGFFLSNRAAGLYSFAAVLARGFLLIGNSIQRNFNPIVSNLWAKKEVEKIKSHFYRVKKNIIKIFLPFLMIACITYPLLIDLFMTNPGYKETTAIFYILLLGIGLMVIFNWSGGMLVMANFLNETLKITIFTILLNILANALLIPIFGIIGAASATSFVYIIRLLIVRHYVKQRMGIKIF